MSQELPRAARYLYFLFFCARRYTSKHLLLCRRPDLDRDILCPALDLVGTPSHPIDEEDDGLDERHAEKEAHSAAHGRGDPGKVVDEVLLALQFEGAGEADEEDAASDAVLV